MSHYVDTLLEVHCALPPRIVLNSEDNVKRRGFEMELHATHLLFPCEKATIVPELASSCLRAAAIVNSGTRRSSVAARSKLASFSRSSLSSPKVVKLNDSCVQLDPHAHY